MRALGWIFAGLGLYMLATCAMLGAPVGGFLLSLLVVVGGIVLSWNPA